MKNSSRRVFAIESEFEEVKMFSKKPLEKYDVRKAPGLDGISSWISKECREQLADKIHQVTESSFEKGVVSRLEAC